MKDTKRYMAKKKRKVTNRQMAVHKTQHINPIERLSNTNLIKNCVSDLSCSGRVSKSAVYLISMKLHEVCGLCSVIGKLHLRNKILYTYCCFLFLPWRCYFIFLIFEFDCFSLLSYKTESKLYIICIVKCVN